ncbi:hypothetical protein CR513_18148, partial [Mucuna pruriens]
MFALSDDEALEFENSIQDTCFINTYPLIALFDSRAAHLFVAHDCLSSLKLPMYDLVVDTPTIGLITTSSFCLQCPLIVHDKNFLVDLIYLPFSQLDVILGMDWLSTNHVLINYASIFIVFGKHVVGKDERFTTTPKENAQVYLMLSSLNVEKEMVASNVLIVKDFLKLAETEFSIDHVLGIEPMSIALYRMAPLELAELKK